jgi:FMN phosphatase YigB (HAD superfamily)
LDSDRFDVDQDIQEKNMIKGILLDYGGTIDTNGLHWANVLKDSYARFEPGVTGELFADAYVFGERSLAINPIVKPSHNFLDILRLKVEQEFNFLREKGCALTDGHIEAIAQECNDFAKETIAKAVPVLAQLAAEYPLVMVSNFYGNLNTVLKDFGIARFFQHVIESAVVGVRKPDAKIYRLGIDALQLQPAECLVIGDSFGKDIVPAKQCGCIAMWLNAKGWEEDRHTIAKDGYKADIEIKDFSEVLAFGKFDGSFL